MSVLACCFCQHAFGLLRCVRGYNAKSDSTRAAFEPVTPSSLAIALMCCLILSLYPPGCSRCTAGWRHTLRSAAYINTQAHSFTPANSLNSIFMFHLLNKAYLAFRNDPLLLATTLKQSSGYFLLKCSEINFSTGPFSVGWSLVINMRRFRLFLISTFSLQRLIWAHLENSAHRFSHSTVRKTR